MISGIHHVKLPVSDVARSRAWYERVLGFRTVIEFEEEGVVRGVALARDGADAQLALRHDPDRAKALSGFDALALRVPERADVAAWRERLDAAGEPHGGVVTGHRGGSVLVGLRDPDGIEIRLYADEGAATVLEKTFDGATVAWTDTGEGEPTLLVHAGGFGAWFAPLADRLPGRVIRMLRAGYTGGPPPPGPIDAAEHAGHAAALLDALGTGPADVVAHSSGCVIALQLALDRPDVVRRLVLSEPPLLDGLLDPADRDQVAAVLGPAMGAAMAAVAGGDLPTAFDAFMAAVCGPDFRPRLVAALGADGVARAERESAFFFANEVPALARWTPPADLSAVTAPVLLVRGGASPGPTHRLVDRLAARFPRADVATVPGADHLLPLTHPDALAAVLARR